MDSGHIRQNIFTREWVVYAPRRGKRPHDIKVVPTTSSPAIAHDPNCPFCPGNEAELGGVILAIPNETHWQLRVVPNRFPAFSADVGLTRVKQNLYLSMPSHGHQEVVIESPKHNLHPAISPLAAIETLIDVYHQRYLALMAAHENMMVTIFRNHGPTAGASLQHPHSQIIATAIVPRIRRYQEEQAQLYFDQQGTCLFCDVLNYESRGPRLVAENEYFLAFIPYAAEVPYETWLMPKKHKADFGDISSPEKKAFAQLLQQILAKLYFLLDNPDYNYSIHTAPRYKAEEPQLHWYCQIRPRLTTPAGFEVGSGLSINPSLPEENAAQLRSQKTG
ncbi:MAG: galactose-1-phosphate uridylyltransferase [Cyanobacteria bacterium P01_H01_bin.15]